MKIIELYLKCWKQKDIASELGVSCSSVSHTLRDPISQEIIKKISIQILLTLLTLPHKIDKNSIISASFIEQMKDA